MNIRSLIYTGAVVLTAVAGPASAFAQSGVLRPNTNPFGTTGFAQQTNNAIQQRAIGTTTNQPLPVIIGNIINIVLSFMGVLLLVYLVYAGFLWMTSSDSKGPEKAKEMIKNAIIGLIIIVSSFAISNFVLNALPSVTGAGGA